MQDGDYDPRRFAYQTVLEMAVTNIDLEGGVDIFARYTPLFTFIGEHNQLEEARKARLAEVDRRIKAGEREVPLDPNDKQPPPTLFLMIQRDGRYLDIAKESKPSKRRNRLKKLQEDTIEFEKQVRLLYKARKEERERQAAAAAPAETTGPGPEISMCFDYPQHPDLQESRIWRRVQFRVQSRRFLWITNQRRRFRFFRLQQRLTTRPCSHLNNVPSLPL